MPKSDRFTKDKTDMLNSYREMNKDLAEEHAIPYIDMRQAFLDAIPSYRLNYKVIPKLFILSLNQIYFKFFPLRLSEFDFLIAFINLKSIIHSTV